MTATTRLPKIVKNDQNNTKPNFASVQDNNRSIEQKIQNRALSTHVQNGCKSGQQSLLPPSCHLAGYDRLSPWSEKGKNVS